jgi:hypothetical protein
MFVSDVAFRVLRTSPVSGNSKSDDIIVRSVVTVDFLGFESEPLRFYLTEIDHETGMDNYDAVTSFIFPLTDRLVLISSSIIVIETHAAPVIGIQA